MKSKSSESSPVSRRNFIKTSAVGVAATAGALSGAAAESKHASDLIVRENMRKGARDWQLTRVRLDQRAGFRNSDIEGYCSKQSVAAGETIDIMVSVKPAEDFRIEVFRTGYYGGRGARLMKTIGPLKGETQPTPKPTRGDRNLHECRWKPAVTLSIPGNWPSGFISVA